jgi:hypothetical protein
MRGPAVRGGHPLLGSSFDASGTVRFSPLGDWRQDSPRPTPAQRRVLAELARGDCLTIDQPGDQYRFRSGAVVARQVVETLALRGWVTLPAAPMPLFGEPAIDGLITSSGRAALIRGTKQW